MDDLSTISVSSTSSLCIARIVHFILYTIRAAVHSNIQNILLPSACSLLSCILLIPLTDTLPYTLAYIISRSSAISTDFNFRWMLRTAAAAKRKYIFQVPSIINNSVRVHIFVYLSHPRCRSASVGELLYGRVKVSLRIVLKNNYQCLLNPMYRFASGLWAARYLNIPGLVEERRNTLISDELMAKWTCIERIGTTTIKNSLQIFYSTYCIRRI